MADDAYSRIRYQGVMYGLSADRASIIPLTLNADGTLSVSGTLVGGLTDTQLRASAVTVSLAGTTVPLPSGAATQVGLDTLSAALGTALDGPTGGEGGSPVTGGPGTLIAIIRRIRDILLNPLAVKMADGVNVTFGAKTDAKSTATDATSISAMQVWKQISASIQAAAASLAGTLTVATHAVTQSGTWNITNVSGTVSLPTGAGTAANQSTIIGILPAARGQSNKAGSLAVVLASDQTGISVDPEGIKATYRTAFNAAPAATPTDFFTLQGSGTKTIRVRRIFIGGIATTAGTMLAIILKRTAANTGGTSAAPGNGITKLDSNDAAATATALVYSANAAGLGAGTVLDQQRFLLPVSGSPNSPAQLEYGSKGGKSFLLRGTTEWLAISFGGAAVPTGGNIDVVVEWTEE